jgi:hypothetical protein
MESNNHMHGQKVTLDEIRILYPDIQDIHCEDSDLKNFSEESPQESRNFCHDMYLPLIEEEEEVPDLNRPEFSLIQKFVFECLSLQLQNFTSAKLLEDFFSLLKNPIYSSLFNGDAEGEIYKKLPTNFKRMYTMLGQGILKDLLIFFKITKGIL